MNFLKLEKTSHYDSKIKIIKMGNIFGKYKDNMHVMIDIETLSTRPNACILTIGAIKFTLKPYNELKPIDRMDTFYRRIDIQSCADYNMHIDPATMDWWKKQDKGVRYDTLEHVDRYPLKDVLQEFTRWFGNAEIVWANGIDFDCVILREAFRVCGLETPWKFWNQRDVRTILNVCNISRDCIEKKNLHNAMYDCYYQIQLLEKAYVFITDNDKTLRVGIPEAEFDAYKMRKNPWEDFRAPVEGPKKEDKRTIQTRSKSVKNK